MASLYVKTAFDVAKPPVVSKILTLTGVHGHLTAALLVEMQDVRGSASFETSGRNSGILGASAKEGWRHLYCGDALPNMCCGQLKKNGRPKAGGYPSVGEHDSEHTFRAMMWADNCWIFSDNREKIGLHDERHHPEVAGSGHGAQAGITVVDKYTQTRGREDLERQRDKVWDLPFC